MSNNAMNYQFCFYYEKYNDANQKVNVKEMKFLGHSNYQLVATD